MHRAFEQFGLGNLPGLKSLGERVVLERALRDMVVVGLAVRHQRGLQLGA